MTTYFDSDVEHLNVFDLAPHKVIKNEMMRYTEAPSDVYGCIDLTNPVRAHPQLSLLDRRCPTLTVMDALRSAGWRPVSGTIVHSTSEKRFDSRDLQSKKRYLQCLLQIEDILKVNVITSGQPQSYYELALMGQKVDLGMGDKRYRECIKNIDGAQEILDNLAIDDSAAAVPSCAPALQDDDSSDSEFGAFGGDGFILDGDAAARPKKPSAASVGSPDHGKAPPPVARGAPSPKESSSSSSSSSSHSDSDSSSSDSDSCDSSDSFEPGGRRSSVTDWVPIPYAAHEPEIKLDIYKPKGKRRYLRYILKCSHHDKCYKRRSAAMCRSFGECEPIAFLIAWHNKGCGRVKADHSPKRSKVGFDDIAAVMTESCSQIQATVVRLRGEDQ